MDIIEKLKSAGVSDEILQSDGLKSVVADVTKKTEEYSKLQNKVSEYESDLNKTKSELKGVIEKRDQYKSKYRDVRSAVGIDENDTEADVVGVIKSTLAESTNLLQSQRDDVVNFAKELSEKGGDKAKKALSLIELDVDNAETILTSSAKITEFKNKLKEVQELVGSPSNAHQDSFSMSSQFNSDGNNDSGQPVVNGFKTLM